MGVADAGAATQIIKCHEALSPLVCKFIVLNFSGVPSIDDSLDPLLVRLQIGIRERDKVLLVCGLSDTLRKRLVDAGIIRTYECSNGLLEALQRIIQWPS